MSQENRKRGKPKGLPKSGGRQKGTPNKNNRRLRDLFSERGFDFVDEMMNVLKEMGPEHKLDALLKLAPYFMQRLREDKDESPGGAGDLDADDAIVSTDDLLKLVGK